MTVHSQVTDGLTEKGTIKPTTKRDLEVIEVDSDEPATQGNLNTRFAVSGCAYAQ